MNIRRTLNMTMEGFSIPYDIKLTPEEMRHAYEEQQHIYDLDDVKNELDTMVEYYAAKFGINEKPVTSEEKEQMARELRRLLNNNIGRSEAQYRCEAVKSVLRKRTAEENKPQAHKITETCPYCENEIEMYWTVNKRGYQAVCPVCGRRLMLCDECIHSGSRCDYDNVTDSCHKQRKEAAKNEAV